MTSDSGWARLLVGGLLGVSVATGCSYSLVDDGELQPDSLEAIVTRVEVTRGIRAERPIDARVVGPDGIRDLIERAVLVGRTREEISGYEAGLVALGLWPAKRDLVTEYVSVMGEEIAGLYLPSERALFVVGEYETPFSVWLVSVLARRDLMAEFALSHEVVHLLQHQRYPELLDDDAFYFRQDDAAIAVQSALEGDAMYFGMLAMELTPDPSDFEAGFEDALDDSGDALAGAPPLIRRLIGFPYAQGYRLATLEGASLLEDPPASTEQALHLERRRADFAVFDLSRAVESLPAGCEVVSENSVGELQISILLRDIAEHPADAASWTGWDGDRYLAARCESAPALFWLTSWDSGEDAAEFADAYRAAAPGLVAGAGFREPLRVHRTGRQVVISSEPLAALESTREIWVREGRVRTLSELRDFAQGTAASRASP